METKSYYLKEVCNIYSGGTPSTKKTEYWDGDYPWLSSGETKQDFIENTDKTITKEGIENSSTKLAKKIWLLWLRQVKDLQEDKLVF